MMRRQCRDCPARVVLLGSPYTGKFRAFDATPVDPHKHQGAQAFPVMSGRAYKFSELVAILQPLRECSEPDAEAEVYDMPWHTIHACPNSERTAP